MRTGKGPILEIDVPQRGLSSTAIRKAPADGGTPEGLPYAINKAALEPGLYPVRYTPETRSIFLQRDFSWLNPFGSR